MKRKNKILIMLLVLSGLFTMQSCTKEDSTTFTVYHAFTEPAALTPADGTEVKISGTTVDLKWASTNADGDAVIADVYFGTSNKPALYKAAHNALTLTVPVVKGQSYYWHVTMKDKNGIMTTSPTFSFTVFEPIGIFVGDFLADEPAEAYSYDVSFAKTGDNTLQTDNYWNSAWTAVFTMDFVNNTYSMPSTTWSSGYFGVEAGTIDPKTGTMVGNYTISRTKNGVTSVIEEGVHTYTKK
jgi:hypothetical protein